MYKSAFKYVYKFRLRFERLPFRTSPFEIREPDSSVGVTTGYGLEGPGIESW